MLLNEISDAELLALAPNPYWVFQEKHDGDRILLVKRGKHLTSYSRSGRETSALPKPIVEAALACPVDFTLDGELVGEDVIFAFDLLEMDGEDLRSKPYCAACELDRNDRKLPGRHSDGRDGHHAHR